LTDDDNDSGKNSQKQASVTTKGMGRHGSMFICPVLLKPDMLGEMTIPIFEFEKSLLAFYHIY
jgi:hypothetical protein